MLRICASNLETFMRIEAFTKTLNSSFLDSFDTAECILEGFDDNLKLVSNKFIRDNIVLPSDAILKRVKYIKTVKKEIDSFNEDKIIQTEICSVEMVVILSDIEVRLVLDNIYYPTLEIGIAVAL